MNYERLPIFEDLGSSSLDEFAKARVRARLFAPRARRRARRWWLLAFALIAFAGSALAAWNEIVGLGLGLGLDRPKPARPIETQVLAQEEPAAAQTLAQREPDAKHAPSKREREAPAIAPARSAQRAREVKRTEASMLAEALAFLREHREDDALVALNAYDRAYPQGALRSEALLARVRAHLALGRSDAALDALAPLSDAELERIPRGRELRLIRGELYATSNQCDKARRDLDIVLALDPPPPADWLARASRANQANGANRVCPR